MWKHVNCMWKPRKGERDVSTLFLHETSKEIYELILEMVLTLMIICVWNLLRLFIRTLTIWGDINSKFPGASTLHLITNAKF